MLDALLVAGSIWLLPPLRAQFAQPSIAGAVLVLAAYCAMCAGMWLLKLLQAPAKPVLGDADTSLGCLEFISIAYIIVVLTMFMLALGVDGSSQSGNAPNLWISEHPAALGVFSVIALAALCLFPAAAISKIKPRIAAGSGRALTARIVGVLGANAMILVTSAWWQAYLSGTEPMGLAIGGRILVAVCCYVVFLMFYAPPRLVLLAVEGDKLSFYIFLLVLAWIVWPLSV